tara:strand:- start:103 stop:525 length:423 start_codon:yes stop_codon:yes gene_type:complete
MKYLVLVLVLFSGHVSALDLVVGLYTKHLKQSSYSTTDRIPFTNGFHAVVIKKHKLNEKNDFIGVKTNKYTFATYNNSYHRRSLMFAYSPFNYKYLTLDIGAVSGYDSTPVFYSVGVKSRYIRAQLFGGTVLSVVATIPI